MVPLAGASRWEPVSRGTEFLESSWSWNLCSVRHDSKLLVTIDSRSVGCMSPTSKHAEVLCPREDVQSSCLGITLGRQLEAVDA